MSIDRIKILTDAEKSLNHTEAFFVARQPSFALMTVKAWGGFKTNGTKGTNGSLSGLFPGKR